MSYVSDSSLSVIKAYAFNVPRASSASSVQASGGRRDRGDSFFAQETHEFQITDSQRIMVCNLVKRDKPRGRQPDFALSYIYGDLQNSCSATRPYTCRFSGNTQRLFRRDLYLGHIHRGLPNGQRQVAENVKKLCRILPIAHLTLFQMHLQESEAFTLAHSLDR